MTTRKRNLKDIIDAVVDDEGLKTEVTITLTDRTLIKTSMYLIGTTIISSLAFFALRSLVSSSSV